MKRGPLRNTIGIGMAAYVLWTNTVAFTTVGIDKQFHIPQIESISRNIQHNSVPVVFDYGLLLGYRLFYNDPNCFQTAGERGLESKMNSYLSTHTPFKQLFPYRNPENFTQRRENSVSNGERDSLR